MPLPREGAQLKSRVRRNTGQDVSILDYGLDRDGAFFQPIEGDVEPTLVETNGLIAKTIVGHQLTAAEIGGDGRATHSINHELAMRQFDARNPRRLWHVDDVF